MSQDQFEDQELPDFSSFNSRAMMGHTCPQDHDKVKCKCGFEGTILDTSPESYSSGGNSWSMLAGRMGVQWHCPRCGTVLWCYWYVVS